MPPSATTLLYKNCSTLIIAILLQSVAYSIISVNTSSVVYFWNNYVKTLDITTCTGMWLLVYTFCYLVHTRSVVNKTDVNVSLFQAGKLPEHFLQFNWYCNETIYKRDETEVHMWFCFSNLYCDNLSGHTITLVEHKISFPFLNQVLHLVKK